jgi:hypothetical protein
VAKRKTSASFFIRCPDCKSEIEIDRATGRIIRHGPNLEDGVSVERFDEVLGSVHAREGRGDSAFDQAAREVQDRSSKLDDVFGDALRKVRDSDDGSKPFNPMDGRWD